MAFIGNTPTTQAFTPAVDYFSGNGSTTAFTLSRPVASVAQVEAVIDNVVQNPSSAYTVSSNTITFTSAPLAGTNNIYVRYTSPINQVIAPGQGTVTTTSLNTSSLAIPVANVTGVTPAVVSDQTNTSTGYFSLPSGTTAQRPASPQDSQIRFNTTLGYPEWYSSAVTSWIPVYSPVTYSATYLIVAGAGGGGASFSGGGGGGGGGAGGMLTGSATLSTGTTYSFTVGGGGAGGVYNGSVGRAGSSGSNSTGFGFTSIGGGNGGGVDNAGGNGGSGGGAGTYGGGNINGGNGTSGQGNNGGSNGGGGTAGGGGGKGSAGASGSAGSGSASSITGSSVTYAAGGSNSGAGTGGANTGNGGGGNTGGSGGAGGSGVVIISVLTANYTGTTTGSPTVTTSGGNTILTYTSSGTYTA